VITLIVSRSFDKKKNMNAYTHTQKYSYRISLEKKSHPCINFSAHEINEKRITKHPHMDHTNHIMLTKKKSISNMKITQISI
jgi:hypothetical protein